MNALTRLEKLTVHVLAHALSVYVLLITSGCGSTWTLHTSYYPKGSTAENFQFEGRAHIVAYGIVNSNTSDRNHKDVLMQVRDRDGHVLLSDRFVVTAVYLKPGLVVSGDRKDIAVELYEVGNELAGDSYNRRLVREGPRVLQIRHYSQTAKSGGYVLKSIEEEPNKSPEPTSCTVMPRASE